MISWMAACKLHFILEINLMLKRFKYQHMLYLVLIATVLSALYLKMTEVSNESENMIEIVSPTIRHTNKIQQKIVTSNQTNKKIDRLDTLLLTETNIFSVQKKVENTPLVTAVSVPVQHVFVPPPPAQTPVANLLPPPKPTPPFRYLGKLLGDDEYQVFLSFQNKNYVLKVGDTIQDMYKVEKIQPPVLALNDISSNTLQEINIGE